MSYNNNKNMNDGNPFYTEELPITTHDNNIHQPMNQPQQQHQPQNMYTSQPQAIFTNTNVNFDDFSSAPPQQSTTYQPDLQFQSFDHSSIDINPSTSSSSSTSNKDRIGGGGVPQGDFSHEPLNNEATGEEKKYGFYQPQYYRFLFNVDTVEVGHRILRSMLPIKFSFFEMVRENPDMYGPWWITITLVLFIAVTANLNEYFHTNHKTWEVDFHRLVYSAISIIGYALIIPLILWGVFKWMKLGVRLLEMMCIYGYSLFIFIPASILCIIPIGIVQWIVIGVSAVVSGAFLVTNIFTPLKGDATKRALIICAVVAALHLGLALLLKLYFFANNTSGKFVDDSSHSSSSHASTSTTGSTTGTTSDTSTTTN
ncbi:hypothetical protein SAMD00019534_094230, partial [Acytostelium subglobosum LB1]|uniref:hypothetical protein n=1 Tax=Acytostelium subglobosum LB1 TaxID=1410327 RepID=UPI000644CE26